MHDAKWTDRWFNRRRKRSWIVAALLVYLLLGYLVLPRVIQSQITAQGQSLLGRSMSAGSVTFNPVLLKLEIHDFRLEDTDDVLLAGFEQLTVDLELRSLIEWAYTFKTLRLDGFYFFFERFSDGQSRLDRLLERLGSEDHSNDDSPLPRLVFDQLRIGNGRVQLRDDAPVETYEAEFGPINISIDDLATVPDSQGDQTVRIEIDRNKILSWEGDISLVPLASRGRVEFNGNDLQRTLAYVKGLLDISELDADFDLSFNYQLAAEGDEVSVKVDDLDVALSRFRMSGLTPAKPLASVEAIRLTDGTLQWPQNRVSIDRIDVVQPELELGLNAQGEPDLLGLLRETPDGSAADETADSPLWAVEINTLNLSDGVVNVEDQGVNQRLMLDSLNIALDQFSLAEQQRMPLTLSTRLGGEANLQVTGALQLFPVPEVALDARVDALPLSLAEAYLRPFLNVRIAGGQLAAEAAIGWSEQAQLRVDGGLNVTDFDMTDTRGAPVVGWQALRVASLQYDQSTNSLNSASWVFTQPHARFHIAEDRTTNIGDLVVEQPDEAASAADQETTTDVLLSGVELRDGRLDFSDRSLPLPFATDINSLSGRLGAFDSSSARAVPLEFEGQVSTYGMARIDGQSRLNDPLGNTQIGMEFRNIKLSEYTPYSVEFAGRKIASGDLDITLEYTLEEGRMVGDNALLIDDFKLGERIDYDGAMNLPLDLAVALLTRPDGSIDLKLPVSGDVNDPQFGFGDTIRAVLSNLLLKAVSAPFTLLAGLVGADDMKLDAFEFLPGRALLSPPEREQAVKLAEAMVQRPGLGIHILPGVHQAQDGAQLRLAAVESRIAANLGRNPGTVRETMLVDADLQQTLESMYLELVSVEPLDQRRQRFFTEDTNQDGQLELNRYDYLYSLLDDLVAAEQLASAVFETLAEARAEAIREAVVDAAPEANLDARITVGETTEADLDGDWVISRLEVTH